MKSNGELADKFAFTKKLEMRPKNFARIERYFGLKLFVRKIAQLLASYIPIGEPQGYQIELSYGPLEPMFNMRLRPIFWISRDLEPFLCQFLNSLFVNTYLVICNWRVPVPACTGHRPSIWCNAVSLLWLLLAERVLPLTRKIYIYIYIKRKIKCNQESNNGQNKLRALSGSSA